MSEQYCVVGVNLEFEEFSTSVVEASYAEDAIVETIIKAAGGPDASGNLKMTADELDEMNTDLRRSIKIREKSCAFLDEDEGFWIAFPIRNLFRGDEE